MDKLKKVFAWFLTLFFALMFKEFARSPSHLFWIPALVASVGLFASLAWVRRLMKYPRHSLSLH